MTSTRERSGVGFTEFGDPAEVVDHRPLGELPQLGPSDVELALVASPINPADLLLIHGRYAYRPPLPAIGGLEGVARVTRSGNTVANVQPGDLVQIPAGAGAWQSHMVADAARLQALPPDIDPLQLAMLSVNPPTAYRMLHHTLALQPGDWLVQNAANSGVGRWVVRLAHATGIRTINLVRRAEVADELLALGADHVVVTGDDRASRLADLANGEPIRLALDAVGGADTGALLSCLAPGGVLVSYGNMAGEPSAFSPSELIFAGRSIRGFNLGRWLADASTADIASTYEQLVAVLSGGDLAVPVAATLPLSDARSAVAAAAQRGRNGKVLFVGPGLVDPTEGRS